MTQRQWVNVVLIAAIAAIPSGTCAGVFLAAFAGGGNTVIYAAIVVTFLLAIGLAKRKVEEQEIHEHTLSEIRRR